MAKKTKKYTRKESVTRYDTSLSQRIKNNLSNFLLGVVIVIILLGSGIKYLLNDKPSVLSSNIKRLFISPKVPKKIDLATATSKYVVKPGDDLCSIAQKFYSDCNQGYQIAEINNLKSPDRIEIGQTLIIKTHTTPTPVTDGDISATMTGQVKRNDNIYIVQEGDFLWKIAEEQYGDGNMADRIAEANNLIDREFLSVGSKLIIPR